MSSPRLAVCCLLLLVVQIFAADLSLVRVGEPWRFYRGTNEPTTPAEAWRQPGFDDSNWPQAASGFSTSPYFSAGTQEATYWPPATNCRAYYLRRTFTVTDPQSVKWLVLRLDYDDGFVAYLNGQEVLRRGLTNNPVAHDDFADYHFGGTAEEFDVSAAAGLLVAGTNVLAIQIHTAATSPPGYLNSMRLVPELLANFQRGPFLQSPATNSIQICWRTPVPADSTVELGPDTNLANSITDGALVTDHLVVVTNLAPGTRYFYRVRSAAGAVTAVSPMASFSTLKVDGDFSFLVLGDSGAGSVPQYQLAGWMEQSNPDLVVHCGDIVYAHFYLGREDYRCLSVYGRQMRSVPFFFTLGNEDLVPPDYDLPFLRTFHLPTNTVTGTEHFYSFEQGNAHFAVLYVPSLFDIVSLRPYVLAPGSLQYQWLTNDLASSTKPWKFMFLHSPVAGSSYHRFDDENANGIYDQEELRDCLLPVAQQYGVQIIFSAHEHDFERSNPMGGVYQVISGGGGGPLPGYYILERDAACSQYYLRYEFTRVTVHGDTLRVEAVDTNGLAFDSFTVQRVTPPAQTYSAAWHTPLVEAAPANDGHGNITGQTFDFIGTPILTQGGEFSNLGRVYVNNDATNLYLGFEQSLLYSNNNAFLFIEAPGLAGVTNLVGLGDGPTNTAQGVNGLDLLENLAFTNFAPAIACLVGDEYADGQARGFLRPGMEVAIGQGVFHLDTNFSDVAGIRLQQFNRSPQILEPPPQLLWPEQNANFIEIAIPYAQLGNLRPGDAIKIAAVVGGPGIDPVLQTRQLDRAFLGTSFTGGGQSNSLLEPVSVRLALDPAGDEDGDGLPNGWELAYGLDPFSAAGDDGAAGDPDHDGMTNWQEFIAGTNPRDPTSILRLTLAPLDPAHTLLSWQAVVGRRYQLEISDGSANFTSPPSGYFPYTATSTLGAFVDELSSNQPSQRFYRLRVDP